jgi:Coenzyme A transferase
VTFVHCAAIDESGNAIASPPYSEGFWAALSATRGAVITAEAVVSPEVARRWPGAIRIPPHKILAAAIEPFGAHPQPLYSAPGIGTANYRDDYDHYRGWRAISEEPDRLAAFVERVLRRGDDVGAAYRAWVGQEKLEALRRPPPAGPPRPAASGPATPGPDERMIILAARHIVRRVIERGHRVMLAGIGHGFFAARLARRWLAESGREVPVIVETGLYDLDVGLAADSFLLSHQNLARTARHSDAEDVLCALTCGADNACLAVLGAAQVDARGRLNSTRLADGRLLVGSGGAADIAAGAADVVVLAPCERGRLVAEVDYVTSPGDRVGAIATDRCLVAREPGGSGWRILDPYPLEGESPERCLALIREGCGFPLAGEAGAPAAPVSAAERAALEALDPENRYVRTRS